MSRYTRCNKRTTRTHRDTYCEAQKGKPEPCLTDTAIQAMQVLGWPLAKVRVVSDVRAVHGRKRGARRKLGCPLQRAASPRCEE